MSLISGAALVTGRYRLDRLVASDRFSEVWQGTDVELARPVAVKLLHADAGAEASGLFRAAACRAASLTHEGLVRIFDYCEPEPPDPARSPFLVMEYVDGRLLAGELSAGPLGAARTVDIVAQVTAALRVVHQAGLGHGDVRPEKILLSDGGAAKLFGFSGACPTGPEAIGADLRALGIIARECLGEPGPPGGDAVAGELQASVADLVAEMCADLSADQPDATADIARRAAALRTQPGRPAQAASSWLNGFAPPDSTQPLRRLPRRARRLAAIGEGPAKRRGMVAVRTAAVIAIVLAGSAIFGAALLEPGGGSRNADRAAAAAMVRVVTARLIGRPVHVVRLRLQRLGLVARVQWRASDRISAGDTIAVEPAGLVPVHSVVVITGSIGRSATGVGPSAGHTQTHNPRRSPSKPPSSSPSSSPAPTPSPSPSSSPAPSPSPTSSPPPSASSSPPSSPSSSSSPPASAALPTSRQNAPVERIARGRPSGS